ncbi:MAG: UDP-3-O-(3-hydroxymyristoyl)glucosamine N-acyltransferase [SAR324 cluster bacterium]|nr:UDP-3-O-(3-hydroxymyristoyl)glucosamine N-acyltransferase [SAR324 cluster bacterium]
MKQKIDNKISISLLEIANLIGGTIKGDKNIIITGFASLKDAKDSDISLMYRSIYLSDLSHSKAAAFLTNEDFSSKVTNAVIVKNPRLSFCKIIDILHPPPVFKDFISSGADIDKSAKINKPCEIHNSVHIGENAIISSKVVLHPGVYIGDNCYIGENSVIMPNSVIYRDCEIGKNALIHANVTIGSDGWGYVIDNGKNHKIPHRMKVIIKDDVEIGANSVIERGSMINTVIGSGAKISSLVHIAHNVTLGSDNLLATGAIIGGSVKTGKNVIIMGGSVVSDSLKLADNTILGGSSTLIKNTKSGDLLYGFPARPKKIWLQSKAKIKSISGILRRLAKIEKSINKR